MAIYFATIDPHVAIAPRDDGTEETEETEVMTRATMLIVTSLLSLLSLKVSFVS